MRANALNNVLNDFNRLPLSDKEYLAKLLEKRLVEAKREAIAQRAEQATENLKKKKVKKGTIEDLRKDLELD